MDIDGEVQPTLCDTGCERTCISERFLRSHPNLYKNVVRPFEGNTISIDGSKVDTIGIINIPFRIQGRHLRMSVRIVRNLVYPFILGWDFFVKYKCSIHPSEGHLTLENTKIPLIPRSLEVTSSHFSLAEDAVIPPLSKMITQASFFINPADNITPTDTVEVLPLMGNISKVAVGRAISRVKDGRFPVELLNPYDTPITIKSDDILGHVAFTSDKEVDLNTEATNIVLSYGSEDSGYESEEVCATQSAPQSVPPPAETPPQVDPPPAFHVDYSTIAEDAKPHLEKLKDLLEVKHATTFSTSDRDRGKTDLMNYQAFVKPGPPISVPAYRATPKMQSEMDCQVHEMIADGLVSHSTSAYSAPVLMVPKKTPGQWRLCTDFRKLNARCERVVYPLPRIEDSLRKLKNPQFFSTMDLQKGFWQVPIAEKDRKFFAFSTGTLHVEYNVMPMGALNSSATMQALMALILRGLPAEHIICFLDDILVASSTMEEHLLHLDLVLGAIGRAGLKLNAHKCLFAQDSVSCLGHRLSRDGISPESSNLDKIKKWKPPQNRTEIRQFLGLTGYYRQMIKGYAQIASPLTHLTKMDTEWKWAEAEQKAFLTLRDYLTSDTIMAFPDFTKPFWVKSDASGNSVGFVLTQKHDNREKVVAYGSKKLTDTQQRYSTYDREFFGILTAVRTYSHYLRQGHFFVVTDHRPLLNLRKLDPKSDATGRRVRWSIELNLYDFDVVYKKGREHGDADAMSRLTDHNDYAKEEDCAGLQGTRDELFALIGLDEGAHAVMEVLADEAKCRLLAEDQDADFAIREVKEAIRRGSPVPKEFSETFFTRNFNRLIIKEGVLYRKALTGTSEIPILQAVIPPKLVGDILKDAHGGKFSGHPGYRRMTNILLRHVVWPGFFNDVKKFVIKCPHCDIVSQPNPPARTELQSINPEYVFQHVCCDLIQLPATAGWKYICVFMDVFSRHVTFYKFRDKSMISFTRALEDYVAHVGCPTKLSCDNGAEFCNELVEATTKVMGIKKRTSVVYRPQSQGMVERINREIVDQLTKRLRQFSTKWPEHMHYVALAHNASTSSRTGESPNMVFFGRELPIPSFTDISVNTLRNKSVKEYVEQMKQRVANVHEAVRRESQRQSAITADYYNKKSKHVPLVAGELVYYKEIPKNREKTDPKWSGPVKVVNRHPNSAGQPGTTYTLSYKRGETITRNYEQLKRVMAEIREPICKTALPSAPAPRIPCLINFSEEEEDQQAVPTSHSPIAARTRSRRTRATTSATVEAPPVLTIPASASSALPALSPPTRELDTTVMPPSSPSEEEEETRNSTFLSHLGPASQMDDLSRNFDSFNMSWDTEAHHPTGIPSPIINGPSSSEEVEDHLLVQAPQHLHVSNGESRPTSSQATTPDLTQNTVLRVSTNSPASQNPRPEENSHPSPQTSTTPGDAARNNAGNTEGNEDLPTGTGSDSFGLWWPPVLSLSTSPDVSETNPITSPTDPITSPTDWAPLLPNLALPPIDFLQLTYPQPSAPGSPPSSILPHNLQDLPSTSAMLLDNPTQDLLEGATAKSPPQADEGESPQNTDSLENFLDVLEEELQLQEKGGRRRTDVLIYQAYEYTRDRPADRSSFNQYWHCRHKARHKCKARLTLRVKDLENITKDATIDNFVPHCHQPYRMKSYGTAEVSVLHSTDGSRGNTTTEGTSKSIHAISQLSEGDFEQDFHQENLTAKVSSSPAVRKRRMLQHDPTQSTSGTGPSVDITTLGLNTSLVDARGYPITRFIPCKRTYRDRSPIRQDEEDRDSSD